MHTDEGKENLRKARQDPIHAARSIFLIIEACLFASFR
jgi:hypothetical protein